MLTDALVLILVGLLAVLLPFSQTYRSRLTVRLAAEAEASVSPEQEATLEARVARRAWGGGGGIVFAGLVVLLADRVWDGSGEMGGGLILSVLVVFGAAGLAVVEIWRPGELTDGSRTARARAPGLDDYLSPRVRLVSGGITGAGLLTLAATLLLTRSEWFDTATILRSPVPVLAAAIPVLLLLTWLAVRRVLDAPQPARDESELYWQDAVRAQTISSMVLPAPLVSLLALIMCGSVLDDAASATAVASGQVGPAWTLAFLVIGYALPFVLVIVGLVVVSGPWWTTETRHFRERLWDGRAPRPVSGRAGS